MGDLYPIWPKIVTPYLPHSKDFFKTLWHNGAQQVGIGSISQFSQKIILSSKRIISTQFGPKLLNLISHDLSQSCFFFFFFFETFQRDGTQQIDKGNISQFSPRNPLLRQLCSFGPKRPKFCILMSQAIMFHDSLSKNYEYILNTLNATEA